MKIFSILKCTVDWQLPASTLCTPPTLDHPVTDLTGTNNLGVKQILSWHPAHDVAAASSNLRRPSKGLATALSASGHLKGGLHNGAFSRYCLGVSLIIALSFDELDQLRGQVHIGTFKRRARDSS